MDQQQGQKQPEWSVGTYANMLQRASSIPRAALSVITRPPVKAPMTTIRQVFMCPTTVLSTAPAPPMMKNWDKLIIAARNPLKRIIHQVFIGASARFGNLSVQGTAYSKITPPRGAWLKRS